MKSCNHLNFAFDISLLEICYCWTRLLNKIIHFFHEYVEKSFIVVSFTVLFLDEFECGDKLEGKSDFLY